MAAKKKLSLGAQIDALYSMREDRLEAARAVDEMKRKERELRNQIMEKLKGLKLQGSKGQTATVSITTDTEPRVTDWKKFHKYLLKTGELDLMQQRISSTAWRERVANGVQVPGVEGVEVEDLSLTKSTRS